MQDRLIRRANAVKDITGNDDEVGREPDNVVDGRAKRRGDIRLPLIDSAGSEPLVLPVAEVEIGEVDQAHCGVLAPL